MKSRSLIICVLISLLYSCSNTSIDSEQFVISNITVIDPTVGIKENQTVQIEKGKIINIEETTGNDYGSVKVDGSGKYLIPGLWDAHVHFAFDKDLASRMLDLFLVYGITSVRDTGGDVDYVNQWKKISLNNPTDAPRVMVAGPLIDGIPNVYDGSDTSHPALSVGMEDTTDIKSQIDILSSKNVDLLKAYEMLTNDQFLFLMNKAKEKDLLVTGHVPLSMDVVAVSNAGLNSMEHLRNLELSCASNADELLEMRKKLLSQGKNDAGGVLRTRIHQAQRADAINNYNDDKANNVLNVLKDNDTWQIPTLALNTAGIYQPFKDKSWQESFKYLPDSTEQRWKQEIQLIETADTSSFQFKYTKWKVEMVKKIFDKGINIMAGTDCPIYYLTPGLSLHQELLEMEKAGIPQMDILATATINPARYFGIENELGSIQKGMIADLLILNKNPLESISNTLEIEMVVKHGKLYERNDLDSILNKLDKN